MRRYIQKFVSYAKKGFRTMFYFLLIAILLPVFGLVWDNFLSGLLFNYGITLENIFEWIVDHPLILPVIPVAVLLTWATYKVITEQGWEDVEFNKWEPHALRYDVLGGIMIHNGKNTDLEECEAELVGCYDDIDENVIYSVFSPTTDSMFPGRLGWFVDGDYFDNITIRQGKEGYIAVCFPTSKEKDGFVVGRDIQYKIKTALTSIIAPFDNAGFCVVRISAKSIAPTYKVLRIEIKNKTFYIQGVTDVQENKWIESMEKSKKVYYDKRGDKK